MSKTFATQRKFVTEFPSKAPTDEDGEAVADHAFRKILVQSKPLEGPVGSAYIELGNTKVICNVSGPRELQSGGDPFEGTLNITIHGLDSAVRHTINSTLSAAIFMKKLARTEVNIELSVLADDGGSLAACLMAASVAISSANIEMFDIVLACHLLVRADDTFILDPSRRQIEEHGGSGLTIGIIPSLRQVVCIDSNGPLKHGVLKKAVRFGFEKCRLLYPTVSKAMISNIANSNSND